MINKRLVDVQYLLAGAGTAFAFAPHHLALLAFLLPGRLLYARQRSFLAGFLYGFGLYAVGVSWLYISLHEYGHLHPLIAIALLGVFISLLASAYGAMTWCYQRYFHTRNPWQNSLYFAALWLVVEALLTNTASGFPWLLLGLSQLTSPLAGFAPILGVYGVGFLTVASSALIHQYTALSPRQLGTAFLLLGILLLVASFARSIAWTQPTNKTVSLSLVQANIPITEKWTFEAVAKNLQTYQHLSQSLHSDVIVWPEGAIPVAEKTAAAWLAEWDERLKQHGQTLISGIPTEVAEQQFHNSLLALGRYQGRYAKRHLVPFGEFIPYKSLLAPAFTFWNIPLTDYVPAADRHTTLKLGDVTIAPFICYEIAFPELVRQSARQAGLLLTVTEDAWFGQSWAQPQHLAIAAMRSLQTGRPQAVSANSGITALLDARGQVLHALPSFHSGVLQGQLPVYTGRTPWLLYPSYTWPLLAFLACLSYWLHSGVGSWRAVGNCAASAGNTSCSWLRRLSKKRNAT